MVSAAWRTRSSISAALSASSTSSKADWSRVIAYSVLCVFLVVHTETHAMTPFYPGGTPNEISSYTTRRDATRRSAVVGHDTARSCHSGLTEKRDTPHLIDVHHSHGAGVR